VREGTGGGKKKRRKTSIMKLGGEIGGEDAKEEVGSPSFGCSFRKTAKKLRISQDGRGESPQQGS